MRACSTVSRPCSGPAASRPIARAPRRARSSRPGTRWPSCTRTPATWRRRWRGGAMRTSRWRRFPKRAPMMTETLGIALLHKSEMDNGVYRAPGDMCLFPPRASAPYRDDRRQRAGARRFLTAYLARQARRPRGQVAAEPGLHDARAYPAGVPQKYLIPPSAFASAGHIGRFVDVAAAAGLKIFSMAGGVIVDDFEATGLLDVVTSSMDVCEPLHILPQQRRRHLHRADQAGRPVGSAGRPQHDSDRLQQRRLHGHPGAARRLGVPDAQVAAAEQLRRHVHRRHARERAWRPGDEHADGGVGRHRQRRPARSVRRQRERARTSCSATRATARSRTSRAPRASTATIHQGRGRRRLRQRRLPGLLSSRTSSGDNLLYHNNRNRTFTEVGEAGRRAAPASFAAWFFDYDNDGWPDIFVASYYFSLDETMRTYLGLPAMRARRQSCTGTWATERSAT